MTYALVKNLIHRCRVRPPPAILMIEEDEVLPLAAYAAMVTWWGKPDISVSELADQIRAGKMSFYGIPVRTR